LSEFFKIKSNLVLTIITIFFSIFNLWLIIEKSPMVVDQEWAQKIFYYHVPLAWNFFIAYLIAMIYSVKYLINRDDYSDIVAMVWAEIGTIFCLLVLITGPIWATPIWGKPWTWEPRLTTTLLIFLTYLVYFMVREFSGTTEQGARLGAIISILAFVDVPIIYFAVDMWSPEAQAHPGRDTISDSEQLIKYLFLFSLVNFSLILINIVSFRIFIEKKLRNINV
jgi:heme exporter protein C